MAKFGGLAYAFSSYSNLQPIVAADALVLTITSGRTTNYPSFTYAFDGTTSLTSIANISSWNVSEVPDMSYMFNNSAFNGDVSNGIRRMFRFSPTCSVMHMLLKTRVQVKLLGAKEERIRDRSISSGLVSMTDLLRSRSFSSLLRALVFLLRLTAVTS